MSAVLLLGAALVNLIVAHQNLHGGPDWWRRLVARRPSGIIIHHSATPQRVDGKLIDAAFIDRSHARRGFGAPSGQRNYHIGYHYVIRGDGVIEPGRPEWMWGSHARAHNDQLGICLVGDFSSHDNPSGAKGPIRPTGAQLEALDRLLKQLIRKYGYQPRHLHRHRDYAPTACPGDRFPFDSVVRRAFEK